MRRFEHEIEQRVSEISRRVVDESEGAVERDQAIVREKDEQLSAFQKGNQKERQKSIEHMMVVEKAIREEHAQRVSAVAVITKSIDKVNRDVTLLLRDEKAAREAREGKLRGQISQSVLKLHAANKDTQRKLESERDGIHKAGGGRPLTPPRLVHRSIHWAIKWSIGPFTGPFIGPLTPHLCKPPPSLDNTVSKAPLTTKMSDRIHHHVYVPQSRRRLLTLERE